MEAEISLLRIKMNNLIDEKISFWQRSVLFKKVSSSGKINYIWLIVGDDYDYKWTIGWDLESTEQHVATYTPIGY